MPNYSLTAINVGSFALGESDRIITLFSAERGLVRAVAKGARKPGTKIAGRADLLNVNKLMLAKGRSLDIIVQAEQIESFPKLRQDLFRLAYGLYYAELTAQFGQGLEDEAEIFLGYLCQAIGLQAEAKGEPALLCLDFELKLLELLGYKPELDFCVDCRRALTNPSIAVFDHDLGGILCQSCFVEDRRSQRSQVAEASPDYYPEANLSSSLKTHITPLVWQALVSASHNPERHGAQVSANVTRANTAGCRLIQTYIEHKAGRRMKALDLIKV
jgi:DNA repair protein RecO (recombination protein O)